jgi:hypothetical protein
MTPAFQRCCNAWVYRSLDSFRPTYPAQRIIMAAPMSAPTTLASKSGEVPEKIKTLDGAKMARWRAET